jgi:hypothetical protein
MMLRRRAGHPTVAAIMVAVAVGCAAQQPNPPVQDPTPSAVPVAPAAAVQFDPQRLGLVPDQPQGWEELDRWITSDFQQFGLRPVDDTEYRYGCNGCAPWTATLTAYAPYELDLTQARTGRPVSVNADGDGFLVEDPAKHAATLTWPYAENAWATVRGTTSATIEVDRMVELARALQPAERTPIRLPLSMANLPDDMPLAQIDVDTHRDEPSKLDYGTRIDFAGCGLTDTGATRDCRFATDSLSVRIAPRDYREPSGGVEHNLVPMRVGGRDGLYDETIHRVSVQLQPGMLAEFDVGYRDQQAVQDIVANVAWASDPGNEASWPAVSDWAK